MRSMDTPKQQLVLNVALTPELRKQMDELKWPLKMSLSEMAREALREFIERKEQSHGEQK